jgi:hypothetical protein
MADYSNIIDELEVIANAFDDVSYFLYNRVSAVNGTQNAKGYPLILVNSTPNTVRGDINNSYLPSKKRFTFDIFCYNLRNRDVQAVSTMQESQAEVDTILDQYVAEAIKRNLTGDNGFSIVEYTTIGGFMAHDVHNDKLVASKYSVTIELDSNCITGTFNY